MNRQALITIFSLFFVFLTSSALCSCGNPQKKVKKVAYMYVYAMANYQVDDAIPHCTQETIDGVIARSRELMETVEPGYIESDTPAKVKILSVEMTSDTTAIAHYNKITPNKELNGQVDLVYRNGKWLVHVLLPSQKSSKTKEIVTPMPASSDTTINGRAIIGFPKKQKQ